ncbi:uncharacterized protein LOC144575718 isoform X2 [Carex rostrata]
MSKEVKERNPFAEACAKLTVEELTAMIRQFAMCQAPVAPVELTQQRLDLPPIDMKLDGPASYLSWSRRVRYTLEGNNLEGYLTGEKAEPTEGAPGRDEWKSTHMQVYIWLLRSLPSSIASIVDGMEKVKDVWAKLKRIYAGTESHMRVFQIHQEINAVVQGDRSIQEYSLDLQRLWADLDHFSQVSSCSDQSCKNGEFIAQMRTMQFLAHLNPAFDQMRSIMLAQTKIPSLDEAIAVMMQEESRMKLHAEPNGPPGARSALATSSLGMTGVQRKTRRCYNCGEIGHLIKACSKPPKERDVGGRGQSGNRGHGRGGRRGGNRTNLMIAEEEEEVGVEFLEEDLTIMDAASQILRTRSPDWIVDSSASRHVTGFAREFSSYPHLAISANIQTTDGTAQPVIGNLSREGDGQGTWDWHMA